MDHIFETHSYSAQLSIANGNTLTSYFPTTYEKLQKKIVSNLQPNSEANLLSPLKLLKPQPQPI